MNITSRLATALAIAVVFLVIILILDRALPRDPWTPQVYALWFLAVTAGPFLGGFLLDAIFGARVRWWRWWYAPVAVALAGFGVLGWLAAQGRPEEDLEYLFANHATEVVFFVFPFVVLIPTVLSAVGVGARRLLGFWVAEERARQRELRQRMLASRRPGSGGSSGDG